MRRVTSAALALAVAGGVYLASPAQASNMGFKLERSFGFVDGGRNIYLVSFPLFNGLADISNGSQCLNPGDPGDGVINAADALCDFFTNRSDSNGGSTMGMQWLDTSVCQFRSTLLTVTGAGGAHFIFGSFTQDLTQDQFREIGYFVNIAKDADDPPLDNRAVIVGSHDPSWGGHQFSIGPTGCGRDMINLPYHTMFRTADELLCGLEGVDWVDNDGDGQIDAGGNSWVDVDGDGTADPCPGGLYDPTSNVAVSVIRLNNAPPPVQFSESRLITPGAGLVLGPNFELTPGDAYLASLSVGYTGRVVSIPHF